MASNDKATDAINAAAELFSQYIVTKTDDLELIAEAADMEVSDLEDILMESLTEIPASDAAFREVALKHLALPGAKVLPAIDPETGAIVYRKIADMGLPVRLEPDPDLASRPKVKLRRRSDDGDS
jgi:DNA-binding Lrp family transcriptional regulator